MSFIFKLMKNISITCNCLIPISSHSVNVKPNETDMFQCDENQGYRGNIATYNCSDHGSFILISSHRTANCSRGKLCSVSKYFCVFLQVKKLLQFIFKDLQI